MPSAPAPAWGQAPAAPQGWPQAPAGPRPTFGQRKFAPTVLVAAIIAGVVLGGIGLDKVVAAPTLGNISIGGGATMTAAAGWVLVETGDSSIVTLQKGNVRFVASAGSFAGTARDIVTATEDALKSSFDQANFNDIVDTTWGGHETAVGVFEAVVSSSGGTGGGTIDGVVIGMVVSPDGVQMLAVGPVGSLDSVADDIKAMADSIEVGQ